jgi:hypothetical protein
MNTVPHRKPHFPGIHSFNTSDAFLQYFALHPELSRTIHTFLKKQTLEREIYQALTPNLRRAYNNLSSVDFAAKRHNHLVWICPYVACFWSQVQEWLENHNIHFKLTLQIAVLGNLESHSQSINNIIVIILVGKVFIFISQSVDTIRLERFEMYVKHHSTIEKYMANGNQMVVVYGDT